jgi:tRNA(Ile)-lysidine synthetase-like protein
MFYDYDYLQENAIGQIIYLDQFSRHFQRFKHLDSDLTNKRLEACLILIIIIDDLYDASEEIVYHGLMVYKHLFMFDELFEFINKYLKRQKKILNEFPILHKFFMDSYKKAYTFERIYSDIQTVHSGLEYDPEMICDSYPENYVKKKDWIEHLDKMGLDMIDLDINPLYERIGLSLKKLVEKSEKKRLVISLSGGVDSMTMLALCKQFGIDCIAVHIVYGNRSESIQEYAFLTEYTKRLKIPLYVYCIEHLKRGHIDREFYEKMTRDIRFFVYKAVGGSDCYVCLGHIKDDIVENIWSNFAKGVHLDNLKMMKPIEHQNGVYICRPFLELTKEDIYKISNKLYIPYLKNSTPIWSNRGKFRNEFYKATHYQYGSSVDDKIVYVADVLSDQTKLINRLLYAPILESYDESGKTFDISRAIEAQCDIQCWSYIFEQLCHKKLGISKPSIHALKDFVKRVSVFSKMDYIKMKVDLKRDLTIVIDKIDSIKHKYIATIIV